MAVLITDELPGMTREMYEGLHAVLEGPTSTAPGFVLHAAGPIDGGRRVNELCEESQQDRDAFFAEHVIPLMPAGGPLPTTIVREIVSIQSR
jgi:hypothetical protein